MTTELHALDLGFRRRYLDHEAVCAQLVRWAEAYPDLIRLESAGMSPEDRDLTVVVVGREPDRVRPSAWIDANMHASELCGTNVCLGVIEDLLALHLEPTAPRHDLSPYMVEALRESLVYVMPRISPDGAEAVLTQGRFIRSVPRFDDAPHARAYWRREDLDGDGLALLMRVQHPAGEFVESAAWPGLMLRRTLDDAGPYYHLYPEGTVVNYDGHSLPASG